jgi:hypothetical protein
MDEKIILAKAHDRLADQQSAAGDHGADAEVANWRDREAFGAMQAEDCDYDDAVDENFSLAGVRAILKATEKRDYGPLADRVRAASRGALVLMADELVLAADLIKPRRPGPKTSAAQQYLAPSKSLAVARTVLRLSLGYKPGMVEGALLEAAGGNERNVPAVKGHVRIAKAARGGWWARNRRQAAKGKFHKMD